MNRFKETWKGVKYARYLIFHPFDGFWDLKYENKGNLSSAMVILATLVLTFLMKNQLTGFILNYMEINEFNIIYKITGILFPFFIWCISNWCITTLVDGEGSFKDIVITTAYATVPLILIQLPMILLSNVITIQESAFYNIFNSVSVIWFAILLFCGILTVHRFGFFKTFLTICIAIMGMVIILFISILFLCLLQDMICFIRLIFNEIQMRMNL